MYYRVEKNGELLGSIYAGNAEDTLSNFASIVGDDTKNRPYIIEIKYADAVYIAQPSYDLTISTYIDSLIDTLKDPTNWTKSAVAVNDVSAVVSVLSSSAVSYCVTGALQRDLVLPLATDDDDVNAHPLYSSVYEVLQNALRDLKNKGDVVLYNDEGQTTHEDIMALLKHAYALARLDELQTELNIYRGTHE